jgi:hypothetical protein
MDFVYRAIGLDSNDVFSTRTAVNQNGIVGLVNVSQAIEGLESFDGFPSGQNARQAGLGLKAQKERDVWCTEAVVEGRNMRQAGGLRLVGQARVVVAVSNDGCTPLESGYDLPIQVISPVSSEQKRQHSIANDVGFMSWLENFPNQSPDGTRAGFSGGHDF